MFDRPAPIWRENTLQEKEDYFDSFREEWEKQVDRNPALAVSYSNDS